DVAASEGDNRFAAQRNKSYEHSSRTAAHAGVHPAYDAGCPAPLSAGAVGEEYLCPGSGRIQRAGDGDRCFSSRGRGVRLLLSLVECCLLPQRCTRRAVRPPPPAKTESTRG